MDRLTESLLNLPRGIWRKSQDPLPFELDPRLRPSSAMEEQTGEPVDKASAAALTDRHSSPVSVRSSCPANMDRLTESLLTLPRGISRKSQKPLPFKLDPRLRPSPAMEQRTGKAVDKTSAAAFTHRPRSPVSVRSSGPADEVAHDSVLQVLIREVMVQLQ